MIVLLNGNFVPLEVPEDEQEAFTNSFVRAIREGEGDPTYFISPTKGSLIFTRNILGWYFRPRIEPPAEKMVKLLEKNLNEGEDWKGGND